MAQRLIGISYTAAVTVAGGPLPATLSAVTRSLASAIGTRLDFLSEPTRTVLRIAALLGPEPRVNDLVTVTGQPATALAEAVDEAVAVGVLTAVTDRLTFRHGLIRASLYEQTPPALRRALHAEAARALAGTGTPVEIVAEHVLAGDADDWAAGWLAAGAGTALVHRAPRVAVGLLDRVLDHLPPGHPHQATVAGRRPGLAVRHRRAGRGAPGRPRGAGRHRRDGRADGGPVVITTVQKFPFVLDRAAKLWQRRYAVIIDKAHSSQSGESANALKKALGQPGSIWAPGQWVRQVGDVVARTVVSIDRSAGSGCVGVWSDAGCRCGGDRGAEVPVGGGAP
jgi:hypothetical protein